MLSFLIGIAGSIAVGLVIAIVARLTSTAEAPSFWAREATAMGLGLAFVAAIVVAAAWTMAGAQKVFGDPALALTVGSIASFGLVLLATYFSARGAKTAA